MVPRDVIVIGDDYPFLLRRVRSRKTGTPATTATVAWKLLDRANVEVSSGAMAQYDAVNAHYDASVGKAVTAALTAGDAYWLKMTVTHEGRDTSLSALLLADHHREAH